jgi:general secretion pathway protein G
MTSKQLPSQQQKGFTLIELMVVIVIVGVMASLVLMNIDGVDQRKAMQARELLILDLKKINREANDQSRIYALNVQSATDVAPFRYSVDEYNVLDSNINNVRLDSSREQKKWLPLEEFKTRELPQHVSFSIEPQEHDFENAKNSELVGTNAPKLIWLGNGETKPVNIQIYYDQKPIGEIIQVDYLGKVSDAS